MDPPSADQFTDAADCSICNKGFHAFRRKHRCKACGRAVCSACARTHKVLPHSQFVRSSEPVRVCDTCVTEQHQQQRIQRRAIEVERARQRQIEELAAAQRAESMRREREAREKAEGEARAKARKEMELRQLEEKHLGPRDTRILPRSRSSECLEETNARAVAAQRQKEFVDGIFSRAKNIKKQSSVIDKVAESEECALCLESMALGHAIFTTACGHSFHWSCLKDMQRSDASNGDKCPACRSIMTQLQTQKACDHPRVRLAHKFCRDCGKPVTHLDVKPRAQESVSNPSPMQSQAAPQLHRNPSQPARSAVRPTSSSTYRAGSQGAVVRCPQCNIQMRVLPHMYNMRVACPSGHQFQVAVSTPGSNANRQNSRIQGSLQPSMHGANFSRRNAPYQNPPQANGGTRNAGSFY